MSCACRARDREGSQRAQRPVLGAGLQLALALVGALPAPAFAQAADVISVQVVEVAGQRGYITPGQSAGLRRGDPVMFDGRAHPVLATSARTSLIGMGPKGLVVGQRGTATPRPEAAEEVRRLPPPTPLSAFAGRWPRPRVPARDQHPDSVPLGSPVRHRARPVRIALGASTVGRVPLGGRGEPLGRARLRARAHAEPFKEVPLALDLDASASLWLAPDLDRRAGQRARAPAFLHALTARYGEPRAWHAIVGRVRHAAAGLGSLDGIRTQAPLSATVSLGAFGGLTRNPLSGAPDTRAARFGAELVYDDANIPLRPRISVTAHGSRYDNRLDERRLFVQADAYPGDGYLGGYGLVSFFDAENPWNAPETEITAAGAHAGIQADALRAGVRLDLQRPERSRFLATYLPREWLCIPEAAPPGDALEACHGDEARMLAQADAGILLSPVRVDVGATISHTVHAEAAQRSGFVHVGFSPTGARARLDATVAGSTGSLFRSVAVTLAPSMAISDHVDVALRYAPALSRYVADRDHFVEQSLGGSLNLRNGSLDIIVSADATYGRDVRLLMLQLITTWWR